ncbi:MAG: RNA methyltransferase PUA domain-containing protein, partial [Acetobacteraceae bacterium]
MSASIRLFVDAPLRDGAAVALAPAQAHYLGPVMRRGPGALVALFNGRDGEWQARLGAIRRGAAHAVAERQLRPQAAEPDLW